jgi:hypothetical protein
MPGEEVEMKKGEIAINTMMVILITIISIILLLGIFSTKLPTFSKSIYCKTFFFIHSSTFVPKSLRAEQDYCKENELLEPPVTLSDDVPLNISLLGYMTACWKEADYGGYTKNKLCYQLIIGPKVVKNPAGFINVSERELTEILLDEDLCKIFSNNVIGAAGPYACGDSDDIFWDITNDEFKEEQDVLIEYQSGKIRVS